MTAWRTVEWQNLSDIEINSTFQVFLSLGGAPAMLRHVGLMGLDWMAAKLPW